MPWYWIVVIVSVIVGPFEALHVYNQAVKRRQAREQKEKIAGEKTADGNEREN